MARTIDKFYFTLQRYKIFVMKKIISLYAALLLCLLFTLIPISCRNTPETINCFPHSPINVTIHLNLPAYQPLNIIGGWQYIDEQSSGTRGLIIVRTNTGFHIYDRNAPHICPDNGTTLEVINDTKIICPKDGAEWMLLTGEMLKIVNVPPKMYRNYVYDPYNNTLTVYQ